LLSLVKDKTQFGFIKTFIQKIFKTNKIKKTWDEKKQSYGHIPFTMACMLFNNRKAETIDLLSVKGCHEGRFIVSMQEKKTGNVACFLVVILLDQPKKENGRYTAEYARPKIYRLSENKCPEDAGYRDCGTGYCIAPPNPFERAIGNIKNEARCSSAVPDERIKANFPELVKKHTKSRCFHHKKKKKKKKKRECETFIDWSEIRKEFDKIVEEKQTSKAGGRRRNLLSKKDSRMGS
jgi:hypothetical protein